MNIKHICVIGLGSIGRRHVRLLREIYPTIRITLVRSGNGQYWPELDLVDNVFYDLASAIDDGIEAAIIASPATLHIEQAMQLASKGIHLIIEKPLSHNLDSVDKLVSIMNASNVTILIGYALRYDSAAIAFKELIDDECIGEILHVRVEVSSYLPDWRPSQDYTKTVSASKEKGGGVLLELSHEIDYIRWFFGEIKNVVAHLYNSHTLSLNVEECVDSIITLKTHQPVSLHMDFYHKEPTRKCAVASTKGTATWDVLAKSVEWKPFDGKIKKRKVNDDRDFIYCEQLKHFFKCIDGSEKPKVSLNDGLEALRIIDAIQVSNKTGRRQEL